MTAPASHQRRIEPTRGPHARRDAVARIVWLGLAAALLVFVGQSVADLVFVLGPDRFGSLLDLDRNNGIPDLISTVAILAAAAGAAALAAAAPQRRWAAIALAVALTVVAVDDLLQAEAGASARGVAVALTLLATAVLIALVVRRAPRRGAVALVVGLLFLAVDFKAAWWYDQLMNHLGLGDLGRGTIEYELGIVIKQGLELLGWSLVAIGIWATVAAARLVPAPVRQRRASAQAKSRALNGTP